MRNRLFNQIWRDVVGAEPSTYSYEETETITLTESGRMDRKAAEFTAVDGQIILKVGDKKIRLSPVNGYRALDQLEAALAEAERQIAAARVGTKGN